MEFKVRVLDFISIYVREAHKSPDSVEGYDAHKLIKGLLKALQVAHADKNTILFDRIKSVLTLLARSGGVSGGEGKESSKESKLLLTEVMALVLKPTKDQKMHQAYIDCFISLTKYFSQSEDLKMVKFVSFTYKELLQKFLGGRGASAHSLNQQFFCQIFEECNSKLGQSLMKPLLRYLLPGTTTDDKLADSEATDLMPGEKKAGGARSNHQRLLAVEIFGSLVKAAGKNPELEAALFSNITLISGVLTQVLKSSDQWAQKKVKKTMLVLGVFTKLGKAIGSSDKAAAKEEYRRCAAQMIKAIEAECEKDKALSNLKGKVKEIQKIVAHI